MSIRQSIAEIREAAARVGVQHERFELKTSDAVALAHELTDAEVRHPDALAKGLTAFAALPAAPTDVTDIEAVLAYGKKFADARDAVWDAFEGQLVDGVEIIWKRNHG